jgi:S-adenosylmethionine:tRNA ribosyltransferase-isomerase
LESLYWLGVKLIVEGDKVHPKVNQWDAYDERYAKEISYSESLTALTEYLIKTGRDQYSGETALMIVPGYQFRVVEGMITNFHMPQSTLLLLVAAFIGREWKVAYEYALNHNFRFLSYGDACLFFRRY